MTKARTGSHWPPPRPLPTSFSTPKSEFEVLTSLGAYNTSTLKALNLSPHPSIRTSSDCFQKTIRIFSATRKYNSSEMQHTLATTEAIYQELLEVIFLATLWPWKPISMSHVPDPLLSPTYLPFIFLLCLFPTLLCACSSRFTLQLLLFIPHLFAMTFGNQISSLIHPSVSSNSSTKIPYIFYALTSLFPPAIPRRHYHPFSS